MNAAEPVIRAAGPDDLDVLAGFALAMASETENLALDEPKLRAGVAALLADPARGRTFVLESGGELAASLMLTTEWSEWRNGFFWWIQSVYVRPSQRGCGHYRRLHEHVRVLAARDPGVCGLRLYVHEGNRQATATYRRLGMCPSGHLVYEADWSTLAQLQAQPQPL